MKRDRYRRFYVDPPRQSWLVVTPGKKVARQFRRKPSGDWVMSNRSAKDAEKLIRTKGRLVPSIVRKYG